MSFMVRMPKGRRLYVGTEPHSGWCFDWYYSVGEYFAMVGNVRLIYTPGNFLQRRAEGKRDESETGGRGGSHQAA